MKRFWIAFCAVVVTTAAIISVVIYCFRSKLSYSLDFGSVIDAGVLVILFLFVDYVYSQQSSDRRADTDLLLGLAAEARTAFQALEQQSQACNSAKRLTAPQMISLTKAERDFSNAIHSIEEGCRHCKIERHKVGFESLKDARVSLKDALTDTPFPGPYDSSALARINAASKAVRDELTRIAFAINHR